MTFYEWWDSLSTRDQRSMDRQLTEAAWQVSAMLMQERCAEAVDDFVNEHTYSRAGNVIRALGD